MASPTRVRTIVHSTVDQMGYKLGNIGVKNPEGNPVDRYHIAKFTYIEDIDNSEELNHKGNLFNSLIIGIEHKNLVNIGNDLNKED
jgi:hypothetical protein